MSAGGFMAQAETAAGGPVVMLVEDFRDTREMMRRMLELQGCRVVEASNGQEAIELSQRGGLDLVLMDLNMPVLDGFNATLRIREDERTRDAPVGAPPRRRPRRLLRLRRQANRLRPPLHASQTPLTKTRITLKKNKVRRA